MPDAVSVLTDIAETLTDLDGRVVHRDLKPENVLLLDGRWCLADFGMARYAEASTAVHTYKGGGSLPYMAPEVWKYQRATSATDIYALGVMAYELLEGTRPFNGPHEHDYQEQHLHGTPPPLNTAPALLAALVTECLFRAPQGRPAAGNVLERLTRIITTAQTGGLAALAEANRAEAVRRAEADRQASAQASEAERRKDLLEAAQASLRLISDQFLTAITSIVSTAVVKRSSAEGWNVRLSDARLTFRQPHRPAPAGTTPSTSSPTPCSTSGSLRTDTAKRVAVTVSGTRTPRRLTATSGSRPPSWSRRCSAGPHRWRRLCSSPTAAPARRSAP
ncbi:serine/threonine protein kinase [Streptomyces sp. NPDC059382]|uniref:serine/threonine protein kinase n=1 Tax=Streptomyces sp. NPDC059382 TaxID=3346816 RepID=UPI0036B22175